ncbi:aminotransferase class V-fold PLP-dependent enzyme [Flavobacteriaceae bacterium]|nr:aminotransferase class V-fold PLP-dependent enzyme [Flavobacteriaceae bacterium]
MKFPALENKIYLDTARSGLMFSELLSWRNKHEIDFLNRGSQFRLNDESLLDQTKLEINKFLGSIDLTTFLVQNFSIGLSLLLKAIKSDKTILMIKDDYSSILNQVVSSGIKYNFSNNTFDLETQILKGINKYNPEILIFSIVQHIDGTLIDLDFIKQIKKDYPDILIIADGTQFCGTKYFNFKNSSIDVLISSGYKWMLGGYGNGFISFNKGFLNSHFKLEKKNFLNLFEPGHHDTLSFGSLLFSLKKISNYGIDKIEKQINTLSIYTLDKLKTKKLLDTKILKRNNHSNIFNIKGDEILYKHLLDNNVICSQRGNGIRISINFYNTKSEIDYFLSLV